MFGRKKAIKENYHAFATGKLIKLDDIPDQVFSKRIMGDGFGIEPSRGEIFSPISGEVTMVFPTGHAYGITTPDGVEVLLHLGVDTVELDGKGFAGKVKQGDKVKQDELLTVMDLDAIKAAGKPTVCMLIFTSGQKIHLNHEGEAVAAKQDDLFTFVD